MTDMRKLSETSAGTLHLYDEGYLNKGEVIFFLTRSVTTEGAEHVASIVPDSLVQRMIDYCKPLLETPGEPARIYYSSEVIQFSIKDMSELERFNSLLEKRI